MEEQQPTTGQRIKSFILALLVVLLTVAAVFTEGWGFWLSDSRTIQGVSVEGINLSWVDGHKAGDKLRGIQQSFEDKSIFFSIDGSKEEEPFSKLGVSMDLSGTVDRALKMGREGNFLKKWLDCLLITRYGYQIKPIIKIDEEQIRSYIVGRTSGLERTAVDAILVINKNDMVEIRPEVVGRVVDVDDALKKVKKIVMDNVAPNVVVKISDVRPKVSAEQLKEMGITGLLSSYTTYFDSGAINRVSNISLATKALNDLMIKPGETVSFNGVVGPRTLDRGYKTAPVINGDKVEPGLGGGICQVSTTLYNSVLLANLQIMERSRHSLPVHYVPAGMDATVSYGTLDFKFKNNTGKYLMLKTFVNGGSITIKIYGHISVKV